MPLRGATTQFATSKSGITEHVLLRFLNKVSFQTNSPWKWMHIYFIIIKMSFNILYNLIFVHCIIQETLIRVECSNGLIWGTRIRSYLLRNGMDLKNFQELWLSKLFLGLLNFFWFSYQCLERFRFYSHSAFHFLHLNPLFGGFSSNSCNQFLLQV